MNELPDQVAKFVSGELNCRGLDTDTDLFVSEAWIVERKMNPSQYDCAWCKRGIPAVQFLTVGAWPDRAYVPVCSECLKSLSTNVTILPAREGEPRKPRIDE